MIRKPRIALIGCGAIGSVLAKAVKDKKVRADLVLAYDIDKKALKKFCSKFGCTPVNDFEKTLGSSVDLVLEAASQAAVREYIPEALAAGKDVMIMSVGALVDPILLDSISISAKENNCKVYLPSGAIAGLDAVKAAKNAGLDKVLLTTRKNPKSLGIEQVKKEKIIYEGPALEAVQKFPANVNVAAALSLAGAGPEKTIVKIIADPSVERNIHEIRAVGKSGIIETRVENTLCPDNPKTSYLAALSAIETLRKITENLEIGT